jgi:hypothetical protein
MNENMKRMIVLVFVLLFVECAATHPKDAGAAEPVRVYLPLVAKNFAPPDGIVLALDDGTVWGVSCWASGTGQENALVYNLAEPVWVDAILVKGPDGDTRVWYRGRVHIYQVHSTNPLSLTLLYSTGEETLSSEFFPTDQFYPFSIVPALRVSGVIMVAIENTVPADGLLMPCLELDEQTGIPANTHWTKEDGVWREHYSLEPVARRDLGYPKIRIRGQKKEATR